MTSSRTRGFRENFISLVGDKVGSVAGDASIDDVVRLCRDQTLHIDAAEKIVFSHWEVVAQAMRQCHIADLTKMIVALSRETFPAAESESDPATAACTGSKFFDALSRALHDKRIIDLQRRRPHVLSRVAGGLREMLTTSPHIREICLHGLPLGDDSVATGHASLFSVLGSPVRGPWPSLTHVALCSLGLTDKSAAPIVAALLRLPALRHVSLAGNWFSDQGFTAELSKLILQLNTEPGADTEPAFTSRADRAHQSSLQRGASRVLLDSVTHDKEALRRMQILARKQEQQQQRQSGAASSALSPVHARSRLLSLDLSFNELSDKSLSRIADLFEVAHSSGTANEMSLSLLNLQGNHFLQLEHLLDLLETDAMPPTLTRILFSGIPASLLPAELPASRFTAEYDPNTQRLVLSGPPGNAVGGRSGGEPFPPRRSEHDERPAVAPPPPLPKYRLPVSPARQHQAIAAPPAAAAESAPSTAQQRPAAAVPATATAPASACEVPPKADGEQEKPLSLEALVAPVAAAAAAQRQSTALPAEPLLEQEDDEEGETDEADTRQRRDGQHVEAPAPENDGGVGDDQVKQSEAASDAVKPSLFSRHHAQKRSRLSAHMTTAHRVRARRGHPTCADDSTLWEREQQQQQQQQQAQREVFYAQLLEDMETNHALEMAQLRMMLVEQQRSHDALAAWHEAEGARVAAERRRDAEALQAQLRAAQRAPRKVVKEPVVVVVPAAAAPKPPVSAASSGAAVQQQQQQQQAVAQQLSGVIATMMRSLLEDVAARRQPTAGDGVAATAVEPATAAWQRASAQKVFAESDDVATVHAALADLGW